MQIFNNVTLAALSISNNTLSNQPHPFEAPRSSTGESIRSCQLDTVLGEHSALAAYANDEDLALAPEEFKRLQMSQAMDFCDRVRHGGRGMNVEQLQYLMALLDQDIESVSESVGIADYRLVDLCYGIEKPTHTEMEEMGDYFFELAEEYLWDSTDVTGQSISAQQHS